MKLPLSFMVLIFRPGLGEDCYFPYSVETNRSGEFGSELAGAVTPCLIWFTSNIPGALRLDFNNKIFASKKEKKSCLSEYIKVQSGEDTWKLCHSNVTTPIQIGVPGQSGHLDYGSPVVALVRWVGALDKSTSYLGRYDFVPILTSTESGKAEGNLLAERITSKLELFLDERGRDQGGLHLHQYHYLTAEDCDRREALVCQHSRFCADDITGLGCNSSLFMCIPRAMACDGEPNCLEGDTSDETGCYLPYVLFTTGGVVLSLTLVASAACLFQHHNMMVKSGMTRYNCDLVRRKDKVKARKADQQPAGPSTISQPAPRADLSGRPPPAPIAPRPVLKVAEPAESAQAPPPCPLPPSPAPPPPAAVSNGHSKRGEAGEDQGQEPQGEEVRRHRRILADEREMLREQRMSGFIRDNRHSSSTQWSQCDLESSGGGLSSAEEPTALLGGQKCNGSVQSCDRLERRRRRTAESMDMVEDPAKGSYGYRFDFRSSCEFEFTEDAYI